MYKEKFPFLSFGLNKDKNKHSYTHYIKIKKKNNLKVNTLRGNKSASVHRFCAFKIKKQIKLK